MVQRDATLHDDETKRYQYHKKSVTQYTNKTDMTYNKDLSKTWKLHLNVLGYSVYLFTKEINVWWIQTGSDTVVP
jgi:hypothetical protein